MRRLALTLIALSLAGCAARGPVIQDRAETPSQAAERRSQAAKPTYNLAGYPPAVREGYIDGCESAKGTAQARKDMQRFAADRQYQMGWNDGFSICGRK